MSWQDIIKVETSSRGFLRENLPEWRERLKEDLEHLKLMLSNLKTLESSLLPFTKGMVGHLPQMEEKMIDMMDYIKKYMPHYKQLIDETEESIKNIGE